VSLSDPLTFIAVTFILSAVALSACYIPRAVRCASSLLNHCDTSQPGIESPAPEKNCLNAANAFNTKTQRHKESRHYFTLPAFFVSFCLGDDPLPERAASRRPSW